jgi:hypothetical protein
MKIVEMIVFANSIKHGAHCVAGKEVKTKEWVRPVANVDGGALSDKQITYVNPYGNYQVKPLQKIKIGLDSHVPKINQPENFQIDGSSWTQNYKISENALNDYLDHPESIWGPSDRVSFDQIKSGKLSIGNSLCLVKVDNLKLYINAGNKRRASFNYRGIDYDLAATDPMFDELLSSTAVLQGILCISLGEEYHGYCYKLVASIY